MRVNENLNVYVSVANNLGMRANDNADEREIRAVQNENEKDRVIATQAVVHATHQTTGSPVNRSLSPFNPETELSRVHSAPANMSSVTYCTTTTAYSRLTTRGPNAAQHAYVTWHGQILGTTEALRVSLAPSYGMPDAIH